MKRKKIIVYLTSLILCFSILIVPTFGKYTHTERGTLFELLFDNYSLIDNQFIITTEKGETSDRLWGDDSNNATEGNNMHSLNDKAFFISNNSGKVMKLSLVINFYLHILNGGSTLNAQLYKIGVNKTYYCNLKRSGQATEVGDIEFTRQMTGGGGLIGYDCNTEINPEKLISKNENTSTLITKEQMEESFVIKDGETAAINVKIFFDGSLTETNLWSKYFSVHLKADPYPPEEN